jgi:diadenosine tetraphosphate (Ap4A) HIT family hydrolase
VAVWRDDAKWRGLRDGTGCPICQRGRPLGVVGESPSTWITTEERVACRGYACVVSKRHVVELFELSADEQVAFFADVTAVARAVDELFHPVKLNYEIHGNTIPHLHLHLFPRYVGDSYESGPIRGGERDALHSSGDIERMTAAFAAALANDRSASRQG